jgi:RND family efflux transporter MFP subunit
MRNCTVWFSGLLAALAMGCNKEQAQAPPPKPPVVMVSYPILKEVTDYEEVTGRAEAKPAVEIRPRVTGYLIKVAFKEGAVVKKGTLLYEINAEPFKAEFEKAEGNLEQSKAKVEQSEADMERAAETRKKGAIAPAEYDKAKADVLYARATVKYYEAALKMAKINLDYCTIFAPFDGRVSRTMLDAGNIVKADETSLTTIVALDPMWAAFDVDERTWLRLLGLVRSQKIKSLDDARMPLRMALADEEGFPHEGVIDFSENKLDPGTGTMRLWARFPNPSGTIITPGMFVRLRVEIGTPYQAVLIAERALGTDQGQKFVYVVNDKNEVEYRKVQTGALHNGLRVVEKGLASGERIIVNGLQRARPGTAVEPKMIETVAQANAGRKS